ncbi:hypothetical protein WBP07_12510 [Novosphingobium sp. BL-8A]|uniref:hypothetical protein n=1 Tax=Novosphingobium sp. BL-8A TaxID=3127639 RepID=UPI0037569121
MQHVEFCAVSSPTLIYAAPRTKEEFDQISLPEQVFEWKDDEAATLVGNDGQQWQTRIHAKMLGDGDSAAVMVIFQWVEYRAVEVAEQ